MHQLHRRGFAVLRGATEADVRRVIGSLGVVIHTLDVRPREQSRALVTSMRDLPPHTDHHRARYIAWLCRTPAHFGGESVLVDARAAYASLAEDERDALGRVNLREHSVFDDDLERHPLVTHAKGQPRIYFSYWLCDGQLETAVLTAFQAFRRAVERGPQYRRKLRADELLIVDNGWMLHGRTAFDDPVRRLQRFWIEPAASR